MLIGTFGTAMHLTPVKAVDSYKWLTITYDPLPMAGAVVPDIAPTVGVHNYTLNSIINVTAAMYVDAGGGVRYEFDHWERYAEVSNTTWVGGPGVNEVMVTMSENKTMTAFYNVQYELTVITPYDIPHIYDGSVWHENVSSLFFDANATAHAGVMKGAVNDWISIGTWARAYLINFTGDATGKTLGSRWYSDPITMDGPKTAIADFVVKYRLWTDPDSEYMDPWGPGSNFYDPGKRGWYEDCTDVDLTAPSIDNENVGNYRWRFDHWIVERYNGTTWVPETLTTENITVHLGPPTKATVYFQLQYYLTVSDSPSMLDTGLESYTGYYDYCTNVTIVAPDPVPDPTDPGTQWIFDHWWLAAVFDVYTTNVTVHIEYATTVGKTLYAIYTKEYYLDSQDNIGDLTGVSAFSGWYAPSTVVALSAPSMVVIDSDTRYVFIEWVKDPGGYIGTENTTINMNGPRNATAFYKLQYRGTWTANPASLNTYIGGWPGETWRDANTMVTYGYYGGVLPGYPYDYYFDHWEVNGVPRAQYANIIQINWTQPITGVAMFEGKPAFFISPSMVVEEAPAVCTTFTVNVTAANLVDLYAMDFMVTWNPMYLELVDVDVRVDEIWTDYFIALDEVNNTLGTYHFIATSLDDYGFNGTNIIAVLTFHIIYDPCWVWPYFAETDIDLTINQLANHLAQQIYPWNIHGGYYKINAIQPTIQMRPSIATASEKDVIFTVEIWVLDAVKLHDFYMEIDFNTDHLDIISVEIDETFLLGPYELFLYYKSDASGYIEIYVIQQQPGETLAYGEGRLATLTFQVHDTIFWTISNPMLISMIDITSCHLSVKCPSYETIPMWNLIIEETTYKYIPIPGDVNMDGIVNVLDLLLVAADMNPGSTYDLDEDWDVDLLDLVLVAINYGRTEP
jgi:hypothetical protein